MAVLDLISWTLKAAKDLKTEVLEPRDLDSGPSREWLLSVQDQVSAAPIKLEDHSSAMVPSISVALEMMCPPGEAAEFTPNDVPSLPDVASALFSTPPATSNEEPGSAMLQVMHRPDIFSTLVDRDRAIRLRWILRDVKSNRLKFFPVRPEDMQTLIELGLVELHGDTALLTNAGATVII
jgi:hypothetical protein